ncbi:MAG: FG-GAP-like repeat-containing protein, partial [Proteobacteria bacterium]|nr:FG-GAP-like repeat-containing protein [Pseudomonadota bacterium]
MLETLVATDINTDGQGDLLYYSPGDGYWSAHINKGNGSFIKIALTDTRATTAEGIRNQRVRVADINRDGAMDIVWEQGNTLRVRYYNYSTKNFENYTQLLNITGRTRDYGSHFFFDYNADGLIDYLYFQKKARRGVLPFVFELYRAERTIYGGQPMYNRVTEIRSSTPNLPYYWPYQSRTRIQYESLTRGKHYTRYEGNVVYTAITRRGPRGNWTSYEYLNKKLYSSINNPFGTTSRGVQDTPDYPVMMVNAPLHVVTQVSSTSPKSVTAPGHSVNSVAEVSVSYEYANARVQGGGRGFLGFETLTTTDAQTGIKTTTKYRQDWPYIGMSVQTTVKTEQGHLLSDTYGTIFGAFACPKDVVGEYYCMGSTIRTVKNSGTAVLGSVYPETRTSVERTYALNNNGELEGALLNTVVTNTDTTGTGTRKRYGNLIRTDVKTYAGVARGVPLKTQTTSHTYGNSATSRRLGRLSRSTSSVTHAGITSTRASDFTYYASGTHINMLKTEKLAWSEPNPASSGNVTRSLTKTHHYDGYGNKTHTTSVGWAGTGSAGTRQSAKTVYDSSGRYALRTEQNFPGIDSSNKTKITGSITSRHSIYGLPLTTRDINNALSRTYYTAMGRPYFQASPNGSWTFTDTEYYATGNASTVCLGLPVIKVSVSKSSGGGESRACIDVLGRTLRKAARSFDGRWVYIDTEYDIRGHAVRSSDPYFASDNPVWTTTQFDLLGRPTRITRPDRSTISVTRSSNSFGGLTTVTTNELRQVKTEVANALGHVISVTDNIRSTTAFTYDGNDNLITTTSPGSGTITMTYDAMGRKIQTSDPNKGTWRYTYNTFGELIEQTDAKGQKVRMRYDALGRKIRREDVRAPSGRNSVGTIEQITLWDYDQHFGVGSTSIGQLVRVQMFTSSSTAYTNTQPQHSRSLSYDSLGRHRSTTTYLKNQNAAVAIGNSGTGNITYTTRQTFDQFGRPFQSFDAADGVRGNGRRGLQTTYNRYGFVSRITDVRKRGGQPITVYSTVLTADARGNTTTTRLGNGIVNTRTHNRLTGLLTGITSTTVGGTNVQNLSYQWDSLANLTARKEHSAGKDLRDTFTYDGLNRLTYAEAGRYSSPYSGTATSRTTATVHYATNGNITYKTNAGNDPYQSNIGSYSYSTSKPHAAIRIGSMRLYYDANGNTTSTTKDNVRRNINYTTFDKPRSISRGTSQVSFAYGPERARYRRIDSDTNRSSAHRKTTWYLGSVEYIEHQTGPKAGQQEFKRNLGGVIETITYPRASASTPSGQSTHYIHTDHLGSTDVITDNRGRTVQRMSFDPWGQRRSAIDWRSLPLTQLFDFSKVSLTSNDIDTAITNRGFTGHEMLDSVGIIHMNGRIYDA